MKLMFVALDFKPNTGGVAEYTYQLAKHLHLGGDRVVVVSRRMEDAEQFDSDCPFPVVRYDFDSLKTGGLSGYRERWLAVQDSFREHECELLISNSIQSEPTLSGLVARLNRVPFCAFVYGREIRRVTGGLKKPTPVLRFRRAVRLLAMKRADRVFCISNYTRRVAESKGIRSSRIVLIHPGIDPDGFGSMEPLSQSEIERLGIGGRQVILSVCRLVERKGLDTAIRAVASLRGANPKLLYVVAGTGPEEQRLKQLSTSLDVGDSVRFVGRISDEDKHAYYRGADLFVMPNRELDDGDVEGFGIVFLEANMYGKPVIGGRSGGVEDAIVDGETGLLVEPNDVEGLAGSVSLLLGDESLARQLGMNGRRRVLGSLTWTALAKAFRAEMAQLLE
jgi:phosphatidylinositol alpha-1,6-mannosyltransferase